MTPILYRRLPGKFRTPVAVSSLYLGPDHLLSVRSVRITEEYQRFYFQDIQSITLIRTARVHYVWGLILLAFTALVWSVTTNPMWAVSIALLSMLFLIARGASCAVYLQTAISRTRLRSLHRLRTAERVLPRIREAIEAVQGQVAEHATVPHETPATRPITPPLPNRPKRKLDLILLFGFMGFEAALVAIWIAARIAWLEPAIAVLSFIEFLCIVIVAIRQVDSSASKGARLVTYASIFRWVAVQGASTIRAYKMVIIDQTAKTIQPLSVGTAWVPYVTLFSLLAVSIAGFAVILSDSND